MYRGGVRLLILDVLAGGPGHGYGIGKAIARGLDQSYEPGPGVLYPSLQHLEDLRLVRGLRSGGRIVYSITPKGRSFLRAHAHELGEVRKAVTGEAAGDSRPVARSAARLRRTILVYLPELSPADRAKVGAILDAARAQVVRLSEGR